MGRECVGAVGQGLGDAVVTSDLSAEALAKAEAIENLSAETAWIASSQELLAMTVWDAVRVPTRKRKWPGRSPAIS